VFLLLFIMSEHSIKDKTAVVSMSPRTKKQNEQLREDRRRSLLQAAVPLFVRNGYDGTSTAEVAKAAGVSHGTVFVYFPTKEDLLRAALLEPLPPTLELVRQLLGSPGSPLERVSTLARVMLTSFAREGSYLKLFQYVAGLRDRFPELAAETTAFSEATIELLRAVVEEGQALGQFLPGDARRLALFFSGFISGVSMRYPAPPEDSIWEDAAQAALRILSNHRGL